MRRGYPQTHLLSAY